jgi:hypothetical protein
VKVPRDWFSSPVCYSNSEPLREGLDYVLQKTTPKEWSANPMCELTQNIVHITEKVARTINLHGQAVAPSDTNLSAYLPVELRPQSLGLMGNINNPVNVIGACVEFTWADAADVLKHQLAHFGLLSDLLSPLH